MAALSKRRDAFLACGSHILVIPPLSVALAGEVQLLADVKAVAARAELPVDCSASAIAILPTEDIERRNSNGLQAVPRETPGLNILVNGGVATVTHA